MMMGKEKNKSFPIPSSGHIHYCCQQDFEPVGDQLLRNMENNLNVKGFNVSKVLRVIYADLRFAGASNN